MFTLPDLPVSINLKQLGNAYFTRKTCWYIAYVPLELINYEKWNNQRYEDNKKIITETKSVKPIIIGDLENNNKYSLIDGNHRSYCCNELGYTHIIAIISKKIKNDKFIIIPTK